MEVEVNQAKTVLFCIVCACVCVFLPGCRADFAANNCVCIPWGNNSMNFAKFSLKVFCLHCSRFVRRITGQLEETGGMTGNDGFQAMR